MDRTNDPHAKAAAALRAFMRQAVLSLAAQLERKGRAHMALPAMRVEGRQQMADAKAIREAARKKGLL